MAASNFDELFPRGSLSVNDLDVKETTHLQQGYQFEIQHRWDGKLITAHEPIKIQMKWHFERLNGQPHKRVIRVNIQAPLFDDPEPPENFIGICPGLWNYECVELFFANDQGHYLEVEVGPHGHWLCLLHRGYRCCFNNGESLELEVQNQFRGSEWNCTLEIPLAYLPGKISKFNAYALHGEGDERHYEALYAITDGTIAEPDFHLIDFYGKIDHRRIIPEGYNRQPFNDLKYGDLWEEVVKEDDEKA